ncbi:MAG: ArsI/CadI family heavy metal resistance metalloenzyme [Actinomycetes bacterium]
MSRVQLALNVSDLDAAIDFYSKLFSTTPAKIRPGYANFAIIEPPLKLVLIEGAGEPGSINHLGVEVATTAEVHKATLALAAKGLATDIEEQTTCCFAVQDKVWVDGPDAERWEVYTVLADADGAEALGGDERCCTAESVTLTSAPTAAAQSGCC